MELRDHLVHSLRSWSYDAKRLKPTIYYILASYVSAIIPLLLSLASHNLYHVVSLTLAIICGHSNIFQQVGIYIIALALHGFKLNALVPDNNNFKPLRTLTYSRHRYVWRLSQ